MKWFAHDSDALHDLKHRRVLKRFGAEGYGVYWMLIELIANEDKELCIDTAKAPLDLLADEIRIDVNKLKEMVDFFAEVDLLDKSKWVNGILYSAALERRADDYTKRVLRRRSGLSPDDVRTDSEQSSPTIQDNTIQDKDKTRQDMVGNAAAKLAEVWNATELPKIQAWSRARLDKLKVRLKDGNFVTRWEEGIKKLSESDFALGKTEVRNGGSPWRATIDCFLDNDTNYLKVLEGKYDNKERDKYARYIK